MTFGAIPDAAEGCIAPAGGCPFSFFTSRKWTYSEAGLTIRDHNAQILAQLAPAGSNRFEGRTNSGQDVALSRQMSMIRKSGSRFSLGTNPKRLPGDHAQTER
jgi:Protease inhibitor Inh